MFLLAVLAYGEPFRRSQFVTFVVIWTALGIYSLGALRGQSTGDRARESPT